MSDTGRHKEIRSHQTDDGAFELVVEDSEVEEIETVEAEPPGKSASGVFYIAAAVGVFVIAIGAAAGVYLMEEPLDSSDIVDESVEFRPYKSSGDTPVRTPRSAETAGSTAMESHEPAEDESEAEENSQEFVEADEVIGDGEIIEGTEEEWREEIERHERLRRVDVKDLAVPPSQVTQDLRPLLDRGAGAINRRAIQNIEPVQLKEIRQKLGEARLTGPEGGDELADGEFDNGGEDEIDEFNDTSGEDQLGEFDDAESDYEDSPDDEY